MNMNTKKIYNVIWFDDQYATLIGIQEQAHLNGIKLYGFSNAKDGIETLEKNLEKYDAAIVDGKFYSEPNQSGDTMNDQALLKVGLTFEKLSYKKIIPWFILSGQISFTKEKHLLAETFQNNKVYDKNKDEDLIALWTDLKEAADKQPLTQIRHKHQKVFDVCKEKYIGEAASKPLMDILLSMENPYENFNDKNYFNALRQIVELFFRASYRLGILHEKFISEKDGSVNLGNSKSFMSGDAETIAKADKTIICSKNYFPKILANNLESILNITNAGSHTSGEEKEELTKPKPTLSEYKDQIESNYLLYSTTFQVMDLLLWFKNYADKNPDVEKNKLEWKK